MQAARARRAARPARPGGARPSHRLRRQRLMRVATRARDPFDGLDACRHGKFEHSRCAREAAAEFSPDAAPSYERTLQRLGREHLTHTLRTLVSPAGALAHFSHFFFAVGHAHLAYLSWANIAAADAIAGSALSPAALAAGSVFLLCASLSFDNASLALSAPLCWLRRATSRDAYAACWLPELSWTRFAAHEALLPLLAPAAAATVAPHALPPVLFQGAFLLAASVGVRNLVRHMRHHPSFRIGVNTFTLEGDHGHFVDDREGVLRITVREGTPAHRETIGLVISSCTLALLAAAGGVLLGLEGAELLLAGCLAAGAVPAVGQALVRAVDSAAPLQTALDNLGELCLMAAFLGNIL